VIHIELLLAAGVWRSLRRLGGAGLLLLGLADSSVIPLPGSMDVLTILLVAHHRGWWLYYCIMATAGSTFGGYITYLLARKGGKRALEKRITPRRASNLYDRFERWGFGAVLVPALLPPPFPFVPFLLAAGALQYSQKRFLAALAVGRGLRFIIMAGLGAVYGPHIVRLFSKYYRPALIFLIALLVASAIVALLGYLHRAREKEGNLVGQRKTNEKAA
jgi:membrane protein YqaA with SNARE-associated domain